MSSPLSNVQAWNLVAPGYLQHNLDDFTAFAQRALDAATVGGSDHVVDVACGPGSLTLPAARRAQRVEAIDFSEAMLTLLKQRLDEDGVGNVHAQRGDGQALPFSDASFDAGFSMFGLMFFPDRARGFSELRRVLKLGGRAVVSSWVPMDDIEVLKFMFRVLFEEAPELAPKVAPPPPPLSTPELVRAEMSAAGFEVEVEEVSNTVEAASMKALFAASRTSFAPVCWMAEQMGAGFDEVWARTAERVAAELGAGPVSFTMRALFGVGIAC